MNLKLIRGPSEGGATIGDLYVNGLRECFTLEDEVRAPGVKIPGRTAIPAGTYGVTITWSPRFSRLLPLLLDVPGFTGVRIHPGNGQEDTEGCILVGLDRTDTRILNSRVAFERLYAKLHGAPDGISLEIIDAPT